VLGLPSSGLNPTTTFVDDLGCDSLDLVCLIMACEVKFCIVISDEDLKFNSIQGMMDYLISVKPELAE
jgi:acyl carrier protein